MNECRKISFVFSIESHSRVIKKCNQALRAQEYSINRTTGGITSDFRPSQAAYNYFFNEVGFYKPLNGNPRIVHQYSDLYVYDRGDATPEDLACIDRAIKEFRSLAHLNIRERNRPHAYDAGTIDPLRPVDNSVHVIRFSSMPVKEEAGKCSEAKLLGGNKLCEVRLEIDQIGGYYSLINPALPANLRCAEIYRDFAGRVGLQLTGTSHPESILHKEGTSTPGLSSIDREVLQMLYDKNVKPGDTPEMIADLFIPKN